MGLLPLCALRQATWPRSGNSRISTLSEDFWQRGSNRECLAESFHFKIEPWRWTVEGWPWDSPRHSPPTPLSDSGCALCSALGVWLTGQNLLTAQHPRQVWLPLPCRRAEFSSCVLLFLAVWSLWLLTHDVTCHFSSGLYPEWLYWFWTQVSSSPYGGVVVGNCDYKKVFFQCYNTQELEKLLFRILTDYKIQFHKQNNL